MSPVEVQTLFGQEATQTMIDSLKKSLKFVSQSPLQKVQYDAQLKMLESGRIPFLELVVFATGGVASTPAPNTSYITIAIMEVVRIPPGNLNLEY
jgi:hypothetical protein